MNLKSRLIRNIGASAGAKMLTAFCSVGSVPILLWLLGVELYAAWLVVSAIPVWLSMADIGFGTVSANEMSIRVSRDDWSGAQAVFQSAFACMLLITAVCFVAAMPFIFLTDWQALLNLRTIHHAELKMTLAVLCLSSLIALHGTFASGLFRAAGQAHVAIWLFGGKTVLDLAMISGASLLFKSLLAIACALLASQLLFTVGGIWYGLKVCRRIRLGVRDANIGDSRYCLTKGIAFCVFPLGNALLLQGTTLVVSSIVGPTGVVLFNTCRTLVRSGQQVMNLMGQSVAPEFSHLVGAQDWPRVRRLHRLTLAVNILLSLTFGGFLLIFGPSIYHLWTGDLLTVDRTLMSIFVLGIIANSLWFSGSVIISSANRHERFAAAYLIGSVTSIIASYFLTLRFGINGAALAPLALDCVLIPVVLRGALSISEDKLFRLFSEFFGTLREGVFILAKRAFRATSTVTQ